MNSYSCLAFILTRVIGTSPERSRVSPSSWTPHFDREFKPTVDGVHDLTICSASATLLDLGVVELEKFINPCNELCPGFAHSEYQLAASLEMNVGVGFPG